MAKKTLLRRTNIAGKKPLLDTQDKDKGIGLGEMAINYESSDVALYTVKVGEQGEMEVCNIMHESHPYKFLSPVSKHNNTIVVDEKKRWQVFKFDTEPNPENVWELAMPVSSPMYWGKEIHSIIENNTSSVMMVTIPSSYKSFDGYEFGIAPNSMAEISIIYDGVDYYVRAVSDAIVETYTVQSEIERGVYSLSSTDTGRHVIKIQMAPED